MFGRKATLPIDIKMRKKAVDDCLKKILDVGELSPSEVEQMAAERLQRLEAKANIKIAQQKQKELYDRKHANPKVYQVGSKVLKKDFARKNRKGGKMDAKYVGPFIITKSLGKGLYALQLVKNRDHVIDRVNGVHLKPYLTPPPSPSCERPHDSTIPPDPDHSLNTTIPLDQGLSLDSTIPPDPDHSLNSTIPPHQDHSPDVQDDTIPPLPPPMPPLDVLIRMNADAPVCDPADGSLSSIYVPGITLSFPISTGGFITEFFPELPVALSPVKSHLPSEPIKPSSISPSKQKNASSRPKKSSSTNPQSKPNKPPSTISPSKPKKPLCRKTHQSTNREQNTRAKQLMLKKRHQKFKKCSPVDVIEVEGYTPKKAGKASKTWVKNHLFTLSREDKSILCSPSAWLSDTIIDAAQKLLKQKVPLQNGFQDICCGRTCAFDIESTEFTQILHNGHDHWLTISTFGAQEAEVHSKNNGMNFIPK